MKGVAPERTKVLHFVDSGGMYGAENVILQLSVEMLKGSVFEPIIGCIVHRLDEKVELFERAREIGASAVKIVVNNRHFIVDVPAAAMLFRNRGVGVIHSHGYKPSVVGYAISLATGIPVLATCHLWFPGPSPPMRYRVMTTIEAFFYRFFRKIVCVSEEIKGSLMRKGIRCDRLVVIKNGINLRPYGDRDEEKSALLRRRLEIPEGEFVAINVGRLAHQKDQASIVSVAELLRERGLPVTFLIVGEGELRESLESNIKSHALEKRVRLLGFRDDVGDLLKCADVFFLPSLDEGLPISLLEAMASSVPVVATSVGAVPEVIEDGKSGILVRKGDVFGMADAIGMLLRDPEKRRLLGNGALQKVNSSYSSEMMFSSYSSVYKEILTNAGVSRFGEMGFRG